MPSQRRSPSRRIRMRVKSTRKSIALEFTVTPEALARARFAELPQDGAGAWSLERHAPRVLHPLRAVDPVEALATERVGDIVVATLAFHQRIPEHDARRVWTSGAWFRRALEEAGWERDQRRAIWETSR